MQCPVNVRTVGGQRLSLPCAFSLQEIAEIAPRPMGSSSHQKKKWGESGFTDSTASEVTQPCEQVWSSCVTIVSKPPLSFEQKQKALWPSQLLTSAVALRPMASVSLICKQIDILRPGLLDAAHSSLGVAHLLALSSCRQKVSVST